MHLKAPLKEHLQLRICVPPKNPNAVLTVFKSKLLNSEDACGRSKAKVL